MKLNQINTVKFNGTDIDRVMLNGAQMYNAWTSEQGAVPLTLQKSIGKPLKSLYIAGAEGGVGDLNEETGKYDIPLSIRGKNLLYAQTTSYAGGLSLKATKESIVINGNGDTNVSITGETSGCLRKLPPGNYRFSYNYISGEIISCPQKLWVGIANDKNNWIIIDGWRDGFGITTESYKTRMSGWFAIAEEMSVSLRVVGCGKFNKFTFGLQVESGTKATAYESYQRPTSLTLSVDAPIESGEGVYAAAQVPTVKGTTIIEANTATAPEYMAAQYKKAR